jgi:alkylation response protein AidB-like acyl-CoA dehydrogenase
VRIPAESLVGELNRGWEIAQTTLAHERGTSARQLVVHRILLEELIALARQRRPNGVAAAAEPVIRQHLAQAYVEVQLLKLHNWRTLTNLSRHGKPGPESSLVKLFWSEMSQRLHDTAMEILGTHAPLAEGDARAVARGRWARSYLYYRAGTIFAGTSEIQRNIIAERVLGLPRADAKPPTDKQARS